MKRCKGKTSANPPGGMRRILAVMLCLLTAGLLLAPTQARAEERKTVRVGWYESTYCFVDQFGRRRGIAYEYQQKIAAYTGWEYEYVEDSWPNLLEMLKAGEIDLLSDVSYTQELSGQMRFSSLPMGSESYYLYIDADNTSIKPEDLNTLNGKRIGVNRGSVQEGFLRQWEEQNGISIQIVPVSAGEESDLKRLSAGELALPARRHPGGLPG